MKPWQRNKCCEVNVSDHWFQTVADLDASDLGTWWKEPCLCGCRVGCLRHQMASAIGTYRYLGAVCWRPRLDLDALRSVAKEIMETKEPCLSPCPEQIDGKIQANARWRCLCFVMFWYVCFCQCVCVCVIKRFVVCLKSRLAASTHFAHVSRIFYSSFRSDRSFDKRNGCCNISWKLKPWFKSMSWKWRLPCSCSCLAAGVQNWSILLRSWLCKPPSQEAFARELRGLIWSWSFWERYVRRSSTSLSLMSFVPFSRQGVFRRMFSIPRWCPVRSYPLPGGG